MRRGILCVLLVTGCFDEQPDKIAGPVTTVANDEGDAEDESSSSSSSGGAAVDAYGPCGEGAECPGAVCWNGTCSTYCGNGHPTDIDECPAAETPVHCDTNASKCALDATQDPPTCVDDCADACRDADPQTNPQCMSNCVEGWPTPADGCFVCPLGMTVVGRSCFWAP